MLIRIRRRVGAENVDRLWLFEPLREDWRELGLAVLSTFSGEAGRRLVFSFAYVATRTGHGLSITDELKQVGEAAPRFLDDVLRGVEERALRLGVVRQGGVAREVEIGGSEESYSELVAEYEIETEEDADL
ncbi:MAG: hypothetical protein J4G12_01785 [Gemmatimonadetes bacterium]|nr:hypothetical protein [Gemmatimonadota bacterium]